MLHSLAFETLMKASKSFKSLSRFRINSVFDQTPKIFVSIINQNYQIQTVTRSKDLLALLKLRSKTIEQSVNLRFSIPSFTLTNEFDACAEHIIIRNLKTKELVGGFRLLSSSYVSRFSCEKKFQLNTLKSTSNRILEISQLFILPEHKHKDLHQLVAQFISAYSLKSGDELIISSQSINSASSRTAALSYCYFQILGLTSRYLNSSPQISYQVPNFEHWKAYFRDFLSLSEQNECLALLSTIFKESLCFGTMIGGIPALDADTNHIDFLTILHKEDLNRNLWKKSPYFTEYL